MAARSEAPRPRSRQPADARRDQILDAATRVFSTSGFHGATVREIAREAGLAEGTIYIYFANKQDLLLGILSRLNESERRAADYRARRAAPGPRGRRFRWAGAPLMTAATPRPKIIDITRPAFKADPFPYYAALRKESPVARARIGRMEGWLVTRYDDVLAGFRDPRLAKDIRSIKEASGLHICPLGLLRSHILGALRLRIVSR
jgi:AcrR family transcriptional regulator